MSQTNFDLFGKQTKKVLMKGIKKYPQHFSNESLQSFERTMRKIRRTLKENGLLNEWSVPFQFKNPEDLLLLEKYPEFVIDEILNERGVSEETRTTTSPNIPNINPINFRQNAPASTPSFQGPPGPQHARPAPLSNRIQQARQNKEQTKQGFLDRIRSGLTGIERSAVEAERRAGNAAVDLERSTEDAGVEGLATAEDTAQRLTPLGRAQDQAVEFLRQNISDEEAWEEMKKPGSDWQKTNPTIRSQITAVDKLAEWYFTKNKDEKAGIDAFTEDRTKSRQTFGYEVNDLKKEFLAMFGDYRVVRKGLADVIDTLRAGNLQRATGHFATGNLRGAYDAAKGLLGAPKAFAAIPGALARHAFGGAQRVVGGLTGVGKIGTTNIRENLSEELMIQELFHADEYVAAPELIYEDFFQNKSLKTNDVLLEINMSSAGAIISAIQSVLKKVPSPVSGQFTRVLTRDAAEQIAQQYNVNLNTIADATHALNANVNYTGGTDSGLNVWSNFIHGGGSSGGGGTGVLGGGSSGGSGTMQALKDTLYNKTGMTQLKSSTSEGLWGKIVKMWSSISPKIQAAKSAIWKTLLTIYQKGVAWIVAHPYLVATAIIAAIVAGASAVVLKRRASRIKTLQNIVQYLTRRPSIYQKGKEAGRETDSAERTGVSRAGVGATAEPTTPAAESTTPAAESTNESKIPSEKQICEALFSYSILKTGNIYL